MRSRTRVDRSNDRTSELGIILAISSIATGVIHAGVVPEHLEETALFGFFILAAAFEIAWAMAVLFRPAVIVYTIGALANGGDDRHLAPVEDDRPADRPGTMDAGTDAVA